MPKDIIIFCRRHTPLRRAPEADTLNTSYADTIRATPNNTPLRYTPCITYRPCTLRHCIRHRHHISDIEHEGKAEEARRHADITRSCRSERRDITPHAGYEILTDTDINIAITFSRALRQSAFHMATLALAISRAVIGIVFNTSPPAHEGTEYHHERLYRYEQSMREQHEYVSMVYYFTTFTNTA